MPSDLQVFTYPATKAPIRLARVDEDGTPWFVAKDVCDVLGVSKSRNAVALLDADEKGALTMGSLGGDQETQIVSEAGLYSLILRSRKPEAKQFKRWVTHEVLPAIRKTGGYSRAGAQPDITALVTLVAQLLPAVTELVYDLRTERAERQQGRISEDDRRQLMRRGKRLHGSSGEAWRLTCQRFDYLPSARQFSTVTIQQLPAVSAFLDQPLSTLARPTSAPALPPKPSLVVPYQTPDLSPSEVEALVLESLGRRLKTRHIGVAQKEAVTMPHPFVELFELLEVQYSYPPASVEKTTRVRSTPLLPKNQVEAFLARLEAEMPDAFFVS